MNFRRSLVIFALSVLITLPWLVAFAEDSAAILIDSAATTPPIPQASTQNEINMQWVWGEVVSLDSQAKTLVLKYLDYETDQEKELALIVDEKTTYENIKSFDEIKVKDILSIDYAAGLEDKNIAKNISLEKPDALPPVPTQDIKDAKPVGSSAASTASTETPASVATGQAQ